MWQDLKEMVFIQAIFTPVITMNSRVLTQGLIAWLGVPSLAEHTELMLQVLVKNLEQNKWCKDQKVQQWKALSL